MRSNRLVFGILFLVCVLTIFPGILFGQADSSISGRVTDSSGAAIAGAKVQASNVNTNAVTPADTNDVGLFTLSALLRARIASRWIRKGFSRP